MPAPSRSAPARTNAAPAVEPVRKPAPGSRRSVRANPKPVKTPTPVPTETTEPKSNAKAGR